MCTLRVSDNEPSLVSNYSRRGARVSPVAYEVAVVYIAPE